MKWATLLVVFGLVTYTSLAQEAVQQLVLVEEQAIPLVADSFYGVDEAGTIFYSKNNVFYKKTSTQTLEFYDILSGELSSVDLINPMRVMLFYRESQTVIFLDNRLNETQRVNLNLLEPYRFIAFASVAGEQQLWLFNLDEQRLERYDMLNNRFLPFLQIVDQPVYNMVSTYNFCHVKTASQIMSFNSYGSLTNTINEVGIMHVATSFKQLLGLQQGKMTVWQQGKNAAFNVTHSTTALPESLRNLENDTISLYLKAGKLYIYNDNRIMVYQTNLLN